MQAARSRQVSAAAQAFSGIFSLISRAAGLSWQLARLDVALRFSRPDLVILSQGGNWDGFLYAGVLRRLGIPAALICQKATELYWPSDWMRARCKAMYAEAQGAYFVSHHNHRLTEEQMGMAIPNAEVVRNPFLTSWDAPLPWPDAGDGLKLACVGRFFPMEKGQDMLLRVMALPKWRARDVNVTFFGAGDRLEGLKEMAAFHGLDNVSFPGFVRNVQGGIWARHHALILPTRAEGLPLVVVETMLAGRVTITTDVAGSAEVCTDGKTGFIAAAPTEVAIDEAMERAWAARADLARDRRCGGSQHPHSGTAEPGQRLRRYRAAPDRGWCRAGTGGGAHRGIRQSGRVGAYSCLSRCSNR